MAGIMPGNINSKSFHMDKIKTMEEFWAARAALLLDYKKLTDEQVDAAFARLDDFIEREKSKPECNPNFYPNYTPKTAQPWNLALKQK